MRTHRKGADHAADRGAASTLHRQASSMRRSRGHTMKSAGKTARHALRSGPMSRARLLLPAAAHGRRALGRDLRGKAPFDHPPPRARQCGRTSLTRLTQPPQRRAEPQAVLHWATSWAHNKKAPRKALMCLVRGGEGVRRHPAGLRRALVLPTAETLPVIFRMIAQNSEKGARNSTRISSNSVLPNPISGNRSSNLACFTRATGVPRNWLTSYPF